MSGRNPAPRRGYGGRSAAERRAERRERLLAAGLELFGTRGYAATSIERLCAAASVSWITRITGTTPPTAASFGEDGGPAR